MFVLGLELITWIVELFVGISRIELHTMLSFALPIANCLFVRCVRNVFQKAIEINDVDDLRLWPVSK